jgi:hypothetical protein
MVRFHDLYLFWAFIVELNGLHKVNLGSLSKIKAFLGSWFLFIFSVKGSWSEDDVIKGDGIICIPSAVGVKYQLADVPKSIIM